MSDKFSAKAKSAAKTDKTEGSLIKCEVRFDLGEWVTPSSCAVFHIDETAAFPQIVFEIKTAEAPPYEWSWVIKWEGHACAQSDGKARFVPKGKALAFSEVGSFNSDSKSWIANLNYKVIGGELTVMVKAGTNNFVRKVFIRAKNPSKDLVLSYLRENWKNDSDVKLVLKIFQQESKFRQFYSDFEPLVSFDNGYGLGQITNPTPSFEKAWNWKKHVDTVMNEFFPDKRKRAKSYLGAHGADSYTQEQCDIETMAFYNGAGRFHKWNQLSKKWEEDPSVICDPGSNRSWSAEDNPGKTADELIKDGVKPKYTGHCYAKHIILVD